MTVENKPGFSFGEFLPGHIDARIIPAQEAVLKYREVRCKIPARFGTFQIKPSKFAQPSRPRFYDVGNIDFAVNAYTQAEIFVIDGSEVIIDPATERPLIAKHGAELIRRVAGMEEVGFLVKVKSDFKIKHAGLASSAVVLHSVAYAINKALGDPLSAGQLITYLAENNDEESNRDGLLTSEPSTGGLGAVCLSGGGVTISGDGMKVIGQTEVPENYTFVLGLPLVFRDDNLEEVENIYGRIFDCYEKIDREWGKAKEVLVNTRLIPAFKRGDIKTIGQIIFDYTLNRYGNIQETYDLFCPGTPMTSYIRSLENLRNNEEIISAFSSSAGSNLVILTTSPEAATQHLLSLGIKDIYYFKPDNKGAVFECQPI